MSEETSIPFDSLGNEQIRFVLVKTAWTNPGERAKLHFQIIAAERAIDLAELQQAIQDDFKGHAEEDLVNDLPCEQLLPSNMSSCPEC